MTTYHQLHPDAVHDVCLCWRLSADDTILPHTTSYAGIPVGTQFRVIYPPSPYASSSDWVHWHWHMLVFEVVMVLDRDGSMARMYRQKGEGLKLSPEQVETFKAMVDFEATVREAQALRLARIEARKAKDAA